MLATKLILLGLGAVLLLIGGIFAAEAISEPAPVSMKYAQFRDSNVEARWLELTECTISYYYGMRIDEVEQTRYGGKETIKDKRYYAALLAGPEDERSVKAFIEVEDAGLKALMEQCWDAEEREDYEFFDNNEARIFVHNQTVRGMATRWDLAAGETKKLLRDNLDVTPDLVVIKQGAEPSRTAGWVLLLLGALAAGGGGLWLVFGRKSQPPMVFQPAYAPYPPPPGMQGPAQYPGQVPYPGNAQYPGNQPFAGQPRPQNQSPPPPWEAR